MPAPAPDAVDEAWFAANQWGPIDPSGAQQWQRRDEQLTLWVPVGDLPPAGDEPLQGLLALRAGGESLGWGFQLQSPVLVTLLAYLMLLLGLNLAGVFSLGGALMGAGQSLTRGGGMLNTFATGVLAAVVASPCTAPFMGAALGFAITHPAWEALAVFLARGWRLALLGAGTAGVLALVFGPLTRPAATASAGAPPSQRTWSEARVHRLTAAGRPVFVNFTAAWCITCKVNQQVALATQRTQDLFEAREVAYLVADWTRRDPAITRQLERYGRSGVPLYLLYSPAHDQPVLLPQLLTEGIVADAINQL
jgi:thiol:disulfide interchange protein DsbD